MKRFFAFLKEKIQIPWIRRLMIGIGLFVLLVGVESFLMNAKSFPARGEKRSFEPNSSLVQMQHVSSKKTDLEDGKQRRSVSGRQWPIFTINFLEEKEVNTVYLDLDFENEVIYRYTAEVTGTYFVGTESFTENAKSLMEVTSKAEHTRYFLTGFTHKIEKLTITLKSVGNFSYYSGATFLYGGIKINEKMPFHFSWLRLGASCLIAGTIMFFVCLYLDRNKIKQVALLPGEEEKKKKLHIPWMDLVVYSIPLIAILLMYALHGNFAHAFLNPDSGTQISKELVDAFLHGHVYLDAEVPEALLALENPYNPSSRSGISGVLWDHLLYNGKYYSYYGITPVFLLFLPMHLLTGQYLYDAYGVLFFCLIGTLFMTLSYERLIRVTFQDKPLPPVMKYLAYGILFVGSGVLFNLERPYFYEVSTSCAFMCAMLALFHLVSCGVIGKKEKGKFFYYHLAASSLWGALSVLSRPTMVLYAVCHIILLGYFYWRSRKEALGSGKAKVGFFLSSLVPYAIFGAIQCIYNYLRFGSFFDFGIEYSLTIADFKNMPFYFDNLLTSIVNFMFGPFRFSQAPFFIEGINSHIGNHYYFFETSSTIGLYIRFPILVLMFLIPFREKGDWKVRLERVLTRWLPCFIIPFVQVAITWQSGFATRYFLDFSWPMFFFLLFYLLHEYQRAKPKMQLAWFLVLSLSLFLGSLITFNMCMIYVPSLTHHYGADMRAVYTRFYYYLAREIAFWR